MLTSLKVLKDTQSLLRTPFQGQAHTFLGVYAHVSLCSWHQVSNATTSRTYAKVRSFMEWQVCHEVCWSLRSALEETL